MIRRANEGRRSLVVHVSAVEIGEETGMGRVATHWRRAFEDRGYEFVHIGPREAGPVAHADLFPRAAKRKYQELGARPRFLLVHEPSAGVFVGGEVPVVTFSHGIERREWELRKHLRWGEALRLRTRIFYPLWRLRPCDRGVRHADALLVINQEDAQFVGRRYGRTAANTKVFRNGVYRTGLSEAEQPGGAPNILFMGSWLERKGRATLVEAAVRLHARGIPARWTLAGTGQGENEVLSIWPQALRAAVQVIPHFKREEEGRILAGANLVVLPSFFEGQPLALLQAMEAGRCCIASNCCGQKDFIRHGETGFLHAPGNAAELAELIAACAANAQLRMQIGRRARGSMSGRSWDQVSDEVVTLVEQALGRDTAMKQA